MGITRETKQARVPIALATSPIVRRRAAGHPLFCGRRKRETERNEKTGVGRVALRRCVNIGAERGRGVACACRARGGRSSQSSPRRPLPRPRGPRSVLGATRARDLTRLAVGATALSTPPPVALSRAMGGSEARRDAAPRGRHGAALRCWKGLAAWRERARARSNRTEGEMLDRGWGGEPGGKEERNGGRVYGPREGAVPPCRPPAVRATRYHWPVMCVSLSRLH